MEQIPNVSVAETADIYQEAAELLHNAVIANESGSLGWAACINAALAVEIYLKSFLAQQVLTPMNGGANLVTQTSVYGHNLLELYEKIPANMKTLMLSASNEIDSSIKLEKLINHCKDYFFFARYAYERKALPCLNSDVVILASHMKKLVRKVGETTHF